MFDEIDSYCERMSPNFWAEPLNALTNIAFLLAAYFAYRLWQKDGTKRKEIFFLIIVTVYVGIGSFLFHTFAVTWALLADVIPIAIFIYTAIAIFLKRIIKLSTTETLIGVSVYTVFSLLLEQSLPSNALNGSVQYLPAFIALVVFAIFTKSKGFILAAFVFSVSITFRSLDMELCDETAGIGTHILWHILNGYLLYLVIKELILLSNNSQETINP